VSATTASTMRIGPREFGWGERTYVMGICNVTPDSFSGDGLVGAGDLAAAIDRTVAQARAMVAEGADLVDIGGESTRPGHVPVSAADEIARVVPAITAVRAAFPYLPISIDTTKPEVAEAAIDAGADLLNDVWGVRPDESMVRVAADRRRPILLGTSRKSTLGRILDLPVEERLEGTLATTALGVAAGVDIVRVHDVRPNARAARVADAIVRGNWRADAPQGGQP
jgi:dihydropteroate synthase